MAVPKKSPDERYHIRSVARALGILEYLASAPEQGRSVTEIAESSGMSKSAAFAVLQTMVSMSFLSDSGVGQNRRYQLGMALARLGDRAREQVSVQAVAHPILKELAGELRISVRLGIPKGDHVLMIDRIDAPDGLRIDLHMGDQEQLHCTAVGKAVLAALADDEVGAMLDGQPLTRRTSHTLTSLRAVLEDLRQVRERGYSIDDEEDFDGVLCIGATICDDSDRPIAAISVTTLKAGATQDRAAHIGNILADGARRISAKLGHRDAAADDASTPMPVPVS